MQGGHPPAGVWGSAPSPVPQHKKQALRAAKGRKKRGSFHPHRFLPSAPTTRFAALANIGVLRAGRAQPLYLLTPSGRFAAFGGKCPPGTRFLSVHLRVALRCAQQPTGLALPSGAPKRVPQHNLASVASGQRLQETRLIPPASFSPIRPHHSFRCPRKYRRSARWPRAALVFAHACGSLCAARNSPLG